MLNHCVAAGLKGFEGVLKESNKYFVFKWVSILSVLTSTVKNIVVE